MAEAPLDQFAPDPLEQPAKAPWWRFVERLPAVSGDEEPASTGQLEIEVVSVPRQPLHGRGRFENNLSRKGIWNLKPDRAVNSGQTSTTDLIGKTTLTYTLGQLGPLEMDLMAWIMGQWHHNTQYVQFTLRAVARAFGRSWKGQFGRDVKDALRRIRGVMITGKVWDAQLRRHTTTHFGLFETVQLVEERGAVTALATVSVALSPWLVNQLRAGQYCDFEWDGYRGRLPHSFARRLYLFLESQDGDADGTVFRVRIDAFLGDSLGTKDGSSNPSRLRSHLQAHGRAICAAHPHYAEVRVKTGDRRGEYWLMVHRSSQWRDERLRIRRRALTNRGE